VSWISFRPEPKPKDTLTVFSFEGAATRCRTTARRAFRVEASAIVGGVYAFRSLPSPLELFDLTMPFLTNPFEEESVEIVAPTATWFSSSQPNELEVMQLQKPFTHVSLPIRRGASSFAIVDVPIAALAAFRGVSEQEISNELLGGERVDPEPSSKGSNDDARPLCSVSIRIEVTWDADAESPSMVVFVSPLRGRRDAIAGAHDDLAQPSSEVPLVERVWHSFVLGRSYDTQ
jgi:hypothetical protein